MKKTTMLGVSVLAVSVAGGYVITKPTTAEIGMHRPALNALTPTLRMEKVAPTRPEPTTEESGQTPLRGDQTPLPGSELTIDADQTGLSWAPTGSPYIGPGVQTYTGDSQCTANFVFTDDAHNVYVGQAAHCASTSSSGAINGCTTGSRPLGTSVAFRQSGPGRPPGGEVLGRGELAYSSWLAMQADGETDAAICAYNDFALVKVDSGDATKVNPSVPHWGGPIGLNAAGVPAGSTVHSYGNSRLRFGLSVLAPQTGTARQTDPAANGWSHSLLSPTPGIPGDSGSAYLDSAGNALGTLSTLGVAIPITNNIGDIAHELSYAQTQSGISGLRLVLGTAAFRAAG